MRLNSLSALGGTVLDLGTLGASLRLRPLEPNPRLLQPIGEIAFCLYMANLCLYARRLNDGEITVPNRIAVLNHLIDEIKHARDVLSDKAPHPSIKDTKRVIKEIGLKPWHLERELKRTK